ncbi:Metallo-dependent phosphatase [Sistotremastrum niveocremeum HHB9708]|uniref:Sphingomyelin phosphodiesterase n=1 Tax=Sistotremastrum niveocremeum HHB9708 TaxID=1314777 RepID=A0A164Q1R8_9AGAM|nr:Metallo-dependent phosphatase [Sistotremastrum niveocremeum HHB9708]
MIALCNQFNFDSFGSCMDEFFQSSDGDVATQVLQFANVSGSDGQYICAKVINKSCPQPTAIKLDLTHYFSKPKPPNARAPPPSGRKSVRVLHLSDFHLDPRYDNGAEADCSQFLCCRDGSVKTSSPNKTVIPAPRWGAFFCDTPYDLAGSVMQAVPELAGVDGSFEWGIFTGDLISHDNDNALGRAYTEYEEVAVFSMIKQIVGSVPVYATLGNHDGWPQAFNTPINLGPSFVGGQFSWNYEHVSSLWEKFDWIDSASQNFAKVHYGAYSMVTKFGLKVISFNTDFWYNDNWFNFVDTENPDISGQFRFIADELQDAEDNHQRVWIIGHVPPGWDGFSALPNPSNLFFQIVTRYSPHVIAEIFFGHNHEDEFAIFYANNATNITVENALMTQWISPSITPLSNLNSGFRAYDVDPVTFNIIDAYTWFSNVTAFEAINNQTKGGAPFEFEYSAREAYGGGINWPTGAPLNATFWHHVTEQWEANPALVETFTAFQGKLSTQTRNCTSSACTTSKICYARSGSQPISALCPFGSEFGSVQ